MTTLASVWTFDCCVWCHISCMWLFIHVSVRINFFFCMSWSNDQSTYKLPEHFWNVIIILFLFLIFVILLCRILGSYCYMCMKWNEMLWEHNVVVVFPLFFLSRKAFRQMFLLFVIIAHISLTDYTWHILLLTVSHSLAPPFLPAAMYLVLVLLQRQNSNNETVYG